jgi:omega-amidase
MQVLGCQFEIAWEDKPANFAKVQQMVAEQSPPAGSLIVLPEMFATGFSMNVARIAEPQQGETHSFLSKLAERWQSYVIGGVATQDAAGKGRNEAIVFDCAGKEIARYCKQQPFTLGGERDHYVAGSQWVSAACGEFSVTPFVCYDLRFPELFRPAVADGAQVIVVIANWPQSREAHWTALLRARAIENQAYVVGVNRCGNDPRLVYPGHSIIVDPQGNTLAEADEREQVLSADLNLKDLVDYRRKFPALADMRVTAR